MLLFLSHFVHLADIAGTVVAVARDMETLAYIAPVHRHHASRLFPVHELTRSPFGVTAIVKALFSILGTVFWHYLCDCLYL